jgi:hypothetical protein
MEAGSFCAALGSVVDWFGGACGIEETWTLGSAGFVGLIWLDSRYLEKRKSMKLTLKCAVSLVLGMGIVGGAMAQNSYSDVSDAHWAADAIKRLSLEKFIQGYPDGTFQGKRNVTRYEMASMIYAIYAKGVCFNEEIDAKLKALEAKINSMSGGAPVDNSDAKAMMEGIRSDLNSMKAWKSDIDNLNRLMGSYQKELTSLGVDLSKMKSDLAAMNARLDKIGVAKGIRITGDANFFTAVGLKDRGFATGINQDGRYAQGNALGAGLDTLTVLHELGLRIQSEVDAKTAWNVDLVAGNAVGNNSGFINQTDFSSLVGTPYGQNGNTALYLHRAVADLGRLGKVGRQGVSLSPYVMRRFDNTSFFANERYDDGKFLVDGVTVGIGGNSSDAAGDRTVGNNKGMVFLGTVSNNATTSTGIVQPITVGGLGVTRVMGANYNLGLGAGSSLGLSYVNYDGNSALVNRFEVVGADFSSDLGVLLGKTKLVGGYGQSISKFGNGIVNDNDNQRLNLGLDLLGGNLRAAYHRVEANYAAPGDWGRVGLLRNLTDVTATQFNLGGYNYGRYSVEANYGMGESINGAGEYKTYGGGVSFELTRSWKTLLRYENTEFDGGFQGLAAGSYARFLTLGMMYDLGTDRAFHLWYQHGDTNGVASFIGAQYSVKF